MNQFVSVIVFLVTENFVTLVALEHIWPLMDFRVPFKVYLRGKCLETLATLEPVRVVLALVMLV
jgi:hypothetical protein